MYIHRVDYKSRAFNYSLLMISFNDIYMSNSELNELLSDLKYRSERILYSDNNKKIYQSLLEKRTICRDIKFYMIHTIAR